MSIRIAARVRPLSSSEIPTDNILTLPSPSTISIPNPRNPSEDFSFSFSSAYSSTATQSEIFDAEVAPSIKTLFSGIDVVLFAYGVTGTGKTHTMRGGKSLATRGMIPRALSSIFRKAKRLENDENAQTKVCVSMSYFEIYNDKVFDLFEPVEKRTPSGLPLRDNGNKTVVVGLSSKECKTLKDFECLYDAANQNRSTGSTKLNAHSSRSHAIVAITLSIHDVKNGAVRKSTFSAIDLAGSEDNRRTENTKERLVESSAINKSLFVLSSCVEAIAKKDSRIPYRESKMTRILSLGQNEGHVIMILNLAPSKQFHFDTLSSLNFATRTKSVSVRERENEYVPISKVTAVGKSASVSAGASTGVGANTGIKRQPLRPLCNNTTAGIPSESPNKKAKLNGKGKSFTIFSDKTSKSASATSQAVRGPLRPGQTYAQTMTKENIEALIDSKLSALSKLVPTTDEQPIKDEDLLSRLARLEQQVLEQTKVSQRQPPEPVPSEPKEDPGRDILRLAKTHLKAEHLEDALRLYVSARTYFPNHSRLEETIARVEERIRVRNEESGERDGEYVPEQDEEDEEERTRTTKGKRKLADMDAGETGDVTPRTKRVLQILSTARVDELKKLKGVGVKKAESLFVALQSAKGEDRLGQDWKWTGFRDVERGVTGVTGKMLEGWRAGVVV